MNKTLIGKSVIGILLCVFLFSTVYGQIKQSTTNTADQTLQSSGRVNPSTLGMGFDLPLGSYPGRGVNIPLGLNYSSKLWRFEERTTISLSNGSSNVMVAAKYSEDAASGWTSSLAQPYVEYTGELNHFDNYGRPLSELYQSGQTVPPGDNYIRRITVYLPGGAHELRAQDEPIATSSTQFPYNNAWEGTFYATDGSGIKYVQNSSIGSQIFRLYLPDGSYYDFNSTTEIKSSSQPTMSVRRGYKLTDINGNYVQFNAPSQTYPNGSWTDQLNRTFPIMVPRETPAMPANQSILEQTYTLPGMSEGYKLRWKKLEDAFMANKGYVLKYTGNTDLNQPANFYTPSLFIDNNLISSCSNNHLKVVVEGSQKFNPVVLTEIVIPNGASYRFSYNEYGEIEQINSPRGGREELQYDKVPSLAELGRPYQMSNRGVTSHKIYESDNDVTADTWTYSASASANNYRTTVIAPDGTQTDRFMHRGIPEAPCSQQTTQGAIVNNYGTRWGYDNVLAGMPYEERVFSSSSPKHIVQRTLTRWGATDTSTILTVIPSKPVQRNARVLSTETITYDGDVGLSAATSLVYDTDVDNLGSPQNVIRTKIYDYNVISGGDSFTPSEAPPADLVTVPDPTLSATLLKSTENVYLQSDQNYQTTKDNYLANNLVRLLTTTRIRNAIDTVVAQTEIKYDEPNYGAGGYRGQPTKVRSWLDTNNSWLETKSKYDGYGNIIETTDAKDNITTFEYSSNYNFFYQTKLTTPVPDASGVNGSSATFSTTTDYNSVTGSPIKIVDPNGVETRVEYVDSLLRVTKVSNFHNNQEVGYKTITEYGIPDSNGIFPSSQKFVRVKTQIDATSWKQAYTWFDGLGRNVMTQAVDSNGDVFTLTEYDSMGRVKRASNSFRNGVNPSCDNNLECTTTTYDTAGRVWKVTTHDTAYVETIYSLATLGQIGTVTTVKDQAGKQRRSITNVLGQLKRIDEPTDSAGLGTINSPNQPTTYNYDLLNNLTQVQQIGLSTQQCGGSNSYCLQTRSFAYDSLSRLKQATNPESGVINYTYDVNNNLLTRTDARGVVTTYAYDNLNRVKTKSYSAPQNLTYYSAASQIKYFYDGIYYNEQNQLQTATGSAKGKLTSASSEISRTSYTAFDAMGRVTQSQQITDGVAYNPMSYVYNLSGALIEQTYPSGRVVRSVLDGDGDLSKVQSKKDANSGYWNYAQNFTYTSAGALSSMQLGNGRWESTAFNSRLQPTQIALGKVQNTTDLLKLDFTYNTPNTTDNNGNILTQTITVPTVGNNQGFTAVQNYNYDSLNHLKAATESINYTQTWKQTFTYDGYGNRTFDEANTTATASFLKNCNNYTTVCAADLPLVNPSVNTTTNKNQLNGYTFDSAGNTTKDAQSRKFTYDGENKQTKVENLDSNGNVTGTVGEYFYDGDGKRVKKIAGNEMTVFVYDAQGRVVAEYSNQIAANPQVSYSTTDHLGSPRINTDKNGNVTARHDYQPFGEEISTSQRILGLGYTSDTVRKKFTGYEKDMESELSYAINRHYSSVLGRFTASDPYNIILEKDKGNDEDEKLKILLNYISQPQLWNKYAYSLNNPLTFSDPDGRRPLNEQDRRRLNLLAEEYGKALKEKDMDKANAIAAAWRDMLSQIAALPNSDPRNDPPRLRAFFRALDYLGDKRFKKDGISMSFRTQGYFNSVSSTDDKCTFFVGLVYVVKVGGSIGLKTISNSGGFESNRHFGGGEFMIGRVDLPKSEQILNSGMANFETTTNPQIGDVVTNGAHTGLVISGNYTISASSGYGVRIAPMGGAVVTVDKLKYLTYKP